MNGKTSGKKQYNSNAASYKPKYIQAGSKGFVKVTPDKNDTESFGISNEKALEIQKGSKETAIQVAKELGYID